MITIICQTIVKVVETSVAKILSDLLSFTSLHQFLPLTILGFGGFVFGLLPHYQTSAWFTLAVEVIPD